MSAFGIMYALEPSMNAFHISLQDIAHWGDYLRVSRCFGRKNSGSVKGLSRGARLEEQLSQQYGKCVSSHAVSS